MEIAMGNAESSSSSPCCCQRSSTAVPQHALVDVETTIDTRSPPPSVRSLPRKVTQALQLWLQKVEEFLFPKCLLVCHHNHPNAPKSREPSVPSREEFERRQAQIQACQHLYGAEGLRALGFEYRLLFCDEHKCVSDETAMEDESGGGVLNIESTLPISYKDYVDDEVCSNHGSDEDHEVPLVELSREKWATDSVRSNDGSCCDSSNPILASHRAEIWTTPSLTGTTLLDGEEELTAGGSMAANLPLPVRFCHLCMRRLYHVASNTPIGFANRPEFIADGDMYELLCRFTQEYAHDVMIQEGNLKWVPIEQHTTESGEPLRVLMSSNHPLLQREVETNPTPTDRPPTVLICTGRGKVRAGIFSRQNLLCTGLEMSTAIPLVRDAVHRGCHVILVDPNVHGDAQGFRTFSRTMDFLEPHYSARHDDDDDLYVLSHSASGGHITRYFLEKSDGPFLRSIRAIAFTDSTHSIQWAKGDHQRYLYNLLQSAQCIYFRCSSSARDTISGDGNKWYLHPAGEMVQTDSFWKHRFGSIRTVWAGTNEHSMTNWFSHRKIWEHFDQFLHSRRADASS